MEGTAGLRAAPNDEGWAMTESPARTTSAESVELNLLDGRTIRRLAPSLLINAAVPLAGYELLRPHVSSDVIALAAGAAIPVVFTIGRFLVRHRVDPVGVLAVAGFGLALLITVLTGGNELVIKLRVAALTTTVGLVFLGSLLARRPAHLLVMRTVARRRGLPGWSAADPRQRRVATVVTAVVAVSSLLHASLIVVLALVLPTGVFLAVSRPVGWLILAATVGGLLWYRRRRLAAATAAAPAT
jgi:hypothetical protein